MVKTNFGKKWFSVLFSGFRDSRFGFLDSGFLDWGILDKDPASVKGS